MEFRAVYETYKDTVFNLVLSYVQNREEAEEVTQDVFLKIYTADERFRGASSYRTWVYRIAINQCLDHLKARKRMKRFAFLTSLFGDDDKLKYDLPAFDHPGVQLEDKEAAAILFSHINSLPPNQKTALILLKIEQRTQAEAAEIMQISEKALESLFQRAKGNLRKKLGPDEGK